MTRFVRWLITKYLPSYAREKYLEEISRLERKIADLQGDVERERAYSAGLEFACRRRVVINVEKGGKANGPA